MGDRRAALVAQAQGLEQRISNLIEAIEVGGVRAGDVAARLAELTDSKARIKQELDALDVQTTRLQPVKVTPEQVAGLVEGLLTTLNEGTARERRAMLRAFVLEIKVFPDHGELTYLPPLPIGQDQSPATPIVRFSAGAEEGI